MKIKNNKPVASAAINDIAELELIKKIKQGDDEAFTALAEKYSRTIFNIGLKMLASRDDAADMTQEVLIKIYRNIGSFRGDAAFSTWVYRISVNTCRDMLQTAYRRRETVFSGFGEEDEPAGIMEVADTSAQPEAICVEGEGRRYLNSLIGRLAPPFRLVLVLREISDLSYQEIAEAANISVGTVKSRLNRARGALREQILQDAEHYPQLLRLTGKKGVSEDEM